MANPWLDIPLTDYEGHMEHVGQARMLDRVFGQALQSLQPQSVAVLGAAACYRAAAFGRPGQKV